MDTAVIGLQWGDEGKGKVVDYLLGNQRFKYCFRFNGGNNAGHTVEKGKNVYKLSLVPTGILTPGIINVITRGVVIDPVHLLKEIVMLNHAGIPVTANNLIIDPGCVLILPGHKEKDLKNNQDLGTTGRGIGPAYEDLYGRRSIRIGELSNIKFENCPSEAFGLLNQVKDAILPYVNINIIDFYHSINEPVLYEGAQGMMLDVFHGSYPYVTSSSTNPAFASVVTGRHKTSSVIGVMKAYSTRVGNGPFPSEITGDPIGKILQTNGREIGTVTGRSRRVGWLDLQQVKECIKLSNCNSIILTKIDVLDTLETIQINKGSEMFETFPGWLSSTKDLTKYTELPFNAKKYIEVIEKYLETPVDFVSTGPDSSSVIDCRRI